MSQLITDKQASDDDVPEDWTWIQRTAGIDGNTHTQTTAYRTRDGYYYINWKYNPDLMEYEVTSHGVAAKVVITHYVPKVAP